MTLHTTTATRWDRLHQVRLFDVPANFVERSPSEIMALAAAQRDGRVDPRTASQLDSIYWNRKTQK